MKILLIEDEPLVAVSLARIVKELEPDAHITGPLVSVKDAKEWLKNNKTDLILSDIQLSDGISLDIFTDDPLTCPIIFTTAYNEYAIRAFKLNSIDYLLKPVEKNELKAALQKFHFLQSKFSNELYLQQMMELFSNFTQNKKYKERFVVHTGRSVTMVPADDIVLFLKEDIIYLVNKEGKKFITDYRSLDEVEELIHPGLFYRANRQHLVHLHHIESYRSDDTGKLILKMRYAKTDDIIISKEKAAEFKKWFE